MSYPSMQQQALTLRIRCDWVKRNGFNQGRIFGISRFANSLRHGPHPQNIIRRRSEQFSASLAGKPRLNGIQVEDHWHSVVDGADEREGSCSTVAFLCRYYAIHSSRMRGSDTNFV